MLIKIDNGKHNEINNWNNNEIDGDIFSQMISSSSRLPDDMALLMPIFFTELLVPILRIHIRWRRDFM